MTVKAFYSKRFFSPSTASGPLFESLRLLLRKIHLSLESLHRWNPLATLRAALSPLTRGAMRPPPFNKGGISGGCAVLYENQRQSEHTLCLLQ